MPSRSGLRWLVFGYPNATTWIANAMAIDGSLTAHSQRPSPHALSVVTCHLHGGRRFNRALGGRFHSLSLAGLRGSENIAPGGHGDRGVMGRGRRYRRALPLEPASSFRIIVLACCGRGSAARH
jgi:hypothetical protein